MALSDRKKKILKAVVDGYIETAAPISSKEIQERCLQDCSSATIRNEMSALESMGYLTQPHISAGRAPSAKAFRLYVDELMEAGPLSADEIKLINSYFNHQIDSVEEMVASVAKIIASITHYPSVVIKGHSKEQVIRTIKLLQLSDHSALVVIVTDAEILKDNFIELPDKIDDKWLNNAVLWLNRLFAGKSLGEIADTPNLTELIGEEFSLYRDLYYKVLSILVKMSSGGKVDVITEGAGSIFEHPEYSDIDMAKGFITAMEHKEELIKMVSNEGDDIAVKINEQEGEMLSGCSVVSAPLTVNDVNVGTASVIGPVRMNYKKVLSVLDHIGKLLDNILSDKESDNNE